MKRTKSFTINLLLLLSIFYLSSCHSQHSQNNDSTPGHSVTTPTHPTFYQFRELMPNGKPFDPNYRPQSISKKNSAHTRESSGGLLYIVTSSGDKYVLFGLEKPGGGGASGKWNFMRGSVDVGDSFVRAASREIHEESAGVYKVNENELLNDSFDVYQGSSKNYACTFFHQVTYKPAQDIRTAAQYHPDYHFREMTDYAWINLDDLISILDLNKKAPKTPQNVSSFDGRSINFLIYDYSFNILKQAHKKDILRNLN